jgi:hypothetical protein
MCEYHAPRLPDACAEDDALEVKEKSKANFCDYFKPSADKYSPGALDAEVSALKDLSTLFGDETARESAPDDATTDMAAAADDVAHDAEALFK